jgi:hypothetical protein
MDPISIPLTFLLAGALAYGVYWAFSKFDRR